MQSTALCAFKGIPPLLLPFNATLNPKTFFMNPFFMSQREVCTHKKFQVQYWMKTKRHQRQMEVRNRMTAKIDLLDIQMKCLAIPKPRRWYGQQTFLDDDIYRGAKKL